jgi:hypothetical protein
LKISANDANVYISSLEYSENDLPAGFTVNGNSGNNQSNATNNGGSKANSRPGSAPASRPASATPNKDGSGKEGAGAGLLGGMLLYLTRLLLYYSDFFGYSRCAFPIGADKPMIGGTIFRVTKFEEKVSFLSKDEEKELADLRTFEPLLSYTASDYQRIFKVIDLTLLLFSLSYISICSWNNSTMTRRVVAHSTMET